MAEQPYDYSQRDVPPLAPAPPPPAMAKQPYDYSQRDVPPLAPAPPPPAMAKQLYDYSQRDGVVPVSWNAFHGLCRALALAVQPWRPELILAIGRGGHYPGTLLAHMLRVDMAPVYLTRRAHDLVVYDHPQWVLQPPAAVTEKRVLVVDEISSSGETVLLVRERALELGASAARVAVLYAHTWGAAAPDYIGLISDALILNPWDREVLTAHGFEMHPEYRQALANQEMEPDASFLIDALVFALAKSGYGRQNHLRGVFESG